MTGKRRIATSRLLVGVLLHFCVPAYLLFCLAAALLKAPVVVDWADVPERMLWAATWFVPSFVLAMIGAAGAGALLDRRARGAPDEVATSREALNEARRLLAPLPHARLGAALTRVDAARWDHADPRHQRIAADLLAGARTFTAAYDSAAAGQRAAVLDLAAASVDRLAGALAQLDDERRRLDHGDARTVAGYLASRYPDA